MGWWKYAKPGDKIVCVNDEVNFVIRTGSQGKHPCLQAGEVYTVSTVLRRADYDVIAVKVLEVNHSGFGVERFCPVQTKSTETGMSILRKIRDGAPVREFAQ